MRKYNREKIYELAGKIMTLIYQEDLSGSDVRIYHNNEMDYLDDKYFNQKDNTYARVYEAYVNIHSCHMTGVAKKHILSISLSDNLKYAFNNPYGFTQNFKEIINQYELDYQITGSCLTLVPQKDINDYEYDDFEKYTDERFTITSCTLNIFPEIRNIILAWYEIARLTTKSERQGKGITFTYNNEEYFMASDDSIACKETKSYPMLALQRLGATDVCYI